MEKPDAIVKEVENYLSHQRIDKIVKDMVVSVLHNKPESVEQHMIKHLLAKTKDAEGEVLVSSKEGGAQVAIVHPEDDVQQYFLSKGIHELFADLLQRIATEKPDDVPAFIASQLGQ